jgi:phytanoyl-CoA hydroxylase
MSMMTQSQAVLSESQIAFFHDQGYLVVEDVFTDRDLQPVIDEVSEEVDRQARRAMAEGRLSRLYEEHGFEHRLAMISQEAPQVPEAMWDARVVLPAFFELMRRPRLLDAVEQLVGPEIIASSVYRLRPKVPSHIKSPVPWHQDSGYFEPYCDKSLVLTVWLPLVDADADNGCLWVKPEGHKAGGVVRHVHPGDKPYLEILPEDLRKTSGRAPICAPVRKGGALLLTNLTPHASFENSTEKVRWSMDFRYQSAALPTNAPISRLPGETEADEAAGVPVACYPPEADFLIRSRLRPDEVIQSAEQFLRLRREHTPRTITTRWSRSGA